MNKSYFSTKNLIILIISIILPILFTLPICHLGVEDKTLNFYSLLFYYVEDLNVLLTNSLFVIFLLLDLVIFVTSIMQLAHLNYDKEISKSNYLINTLCISFSFIVLIFMFLFILVSKFLPSNIMFGMIFLPVICIILLILFLIAIIYEKRAIKK